MEKLHTNAAPQGEGRAAVSPHAGTHGTARLNRGATQGTQGLQCCAQGQSVTGAPMLLLGWLLVFFCQAPGVGPRTFWEAACISAFTVLGLQSSRGLAADGAELPRHSCRARLATSRCKNASMGNSF